MNPEFKEWFLTQAGNPLLGFTSADNPTEQETPAASKTKVVNGVTIGTIFKEDNEPTEENYTKLFKSITFKLNASDIAKDSANNRNAQNQIYAGLVTVATDAEAIAFDNGDETKETRVPRVHHLPETVEGNNVVISGFAITTINAAPVNSVAVARDITNNTKSIYKVNLADTFLNWQKDNVAKIKDYVDSSAISGSVTIDSGPSLFTVNETPATGTDTKKFTVAITVGVDTDATLSSNSDTKIASQKAVKSAIDALAATIANKAEAVDVAALTTAINTLTGGQPAVPAAAASDLAILQSVVNTKLSKNSDDTANGIITFVQVPITNVAPTNSNHITNKAYVDGQLANYYTKAEVDSLFAVERNRISLLETAVASLQSQLNNLPSTYYNKTEVDTLLNGKSDVGHTHTGVYHPAVAGGLSDERIIRNLSAIRIENGIVVSIAT